MADCSKNKNPLVHSGTNQYQRFLPALDGNFIVPDEKSFKEWLVYARDLASHIKYYNSSNKEDGDWQAFFDSDASAILALIAVQDVNDYKDRIRSLFDTILSKDHKNDVTKLQKSYGLLFSAIFSLSFRLDYFGEILPENISLKRTISNLILTKLAPLLKRILGYYKAAAGFYTPALIEDDVVNDWTILAFRQTKVSEIIVLMEKLTDKWIYKPVLAEEFDDYFSNEISTDNSIYNHDVSTIANTDVWEVLNHAVNHNLFSSVFAEYLSVYARIVKDAQNQLIKTITDQNSHEPHYALYLSFLHLFKIAQGEMNTYTKRHLDFYYKNVLRLTEKKSEPNHVHLVFEPANMINDHLIKKGTLFNAGKDSEGKEVLYSSDEDIIINKARVLELRSFYRELSETSATPFSGMLFASSHSNSADGAGAKLESESKAWHPFANKLFTDGLLSNISMPKAEIGFAIASHYLFLNEGTRTINITLRGTSLNALKGKKFFCYLTTEKKWMENTGFSISATSGSAAIKIVINAADPAITAFDQKVHPDNYRNVDTPVIKFILQNEDGINQYDDLKDVLITGIDIKVKAGVLNKYNLNGLKELLVSSDSGTVDPSKPFMPFGQNPKAGAGLVIGNKEIFSKKGAKITLSVFWAEMDLTIQDMDYNISDIFFPTAQVKFLRSGIWTDMDQTSILNSEHLTAKKGEVELFWGKNSVMFSEAYLPSFSVRIPDDSIIDFREDYSQYGISSQKGYLKLELNADFQFDKYFSALQLYLIQVANKTITGNDIETRKPIKPYTPKIQTINLSYEAETSINFSSIGDGSTRLIHIFPFGNDLIDSSNVEMNKVNLMPQFIHTEEGVPVHNIAEFYIGLKDVVPEQKVSLFFKVLDGSTDPLQSKPEKHVFWSYLSNNVWVDYDKNELIDNTRQLIETGTISFPFNEKATNNNTLLPGGYYWIKASIEKLPGQVCHLIDVKAQAVRATFNDRNNAEDFLQQTLAANTIQKFAEPDANVKKVEQPYSSFGGRYKEDPQNYYTRVSERLRHKNRAITIRDFEQLVLEEFPDIHKVKCLNHTKLDLEVSPAVYNELAPGNVTLITIPDLHLKNAINPLRPYTSRSRLEEIRDFVKTVSNCNMSVYVENPAFEEIRIKSVIVLTDAASGNDSYYNDLIKQELVEYLTPWAYNSNTEISFGGRITKSHIINFIEERTYVEVILDLKMFHNKMDGTAESGDKEEIIASTARSILVSAPASSHSITILPKSKITENNECK